MLYFALRIPLHIDYDASKILQILKGMLSGSALDFKSKLNQQKSKGPIFAIFFLIIMTSDRVMYLSEEMAAVIKGIS